LNVRVDGQLTFNRPAQIVEATEAGFGLGFLPEDHVGQAVGQGRLVRVLEDWCRLFSGYHLYYPSRRQASRAFQLVVEALRYRG
jgi:DNA-binding transcriptional LysR family regulator